MGAIVQNSIIYVMNIGVFINIFFYLNYANIVRIPEYIIYFLLFAVLSFLYLIKKKDIVISKSLSTWVVFYFFVNTIYLVEAGFSNSVYQFYPIIIMYVIVFLAFSLLCHLDDDQLSMSRKGVASGAIIGVILLLIDFTIPGYFAVGDNTVAGRAIAMYGNSNFAAIALILALILSIDIIDKNLKLYYILIIFIGVLVTFSRSGLLVFILITSIMAYQNKISKKTFMVMVSSIISFLIFLLLGGFEVIATTFDIEITDNLINRISFFVDSDNAETGDMDERKRVLLAALDLFADSPFFGDGFAATRLWDHRVSPHNTFAVTLAE
ncbi:MAG: hypothetical protein DRG78_21425, partial [Epsilonproteobacteria bacterium]